MSKQSKSGGGNMLLLAGLGIGAFMLLSKKGNAQTDAASASLPSSGEAGSDIPEAPTILAVNNSSTESPTPTGIVSDEEGMEVTRAASATSSNASAQQSAYTDDEDDMYAGGSAATSIVNAGITAIKQAQSAAKIPSVISTKLTPKEQVVVNAGKLTAELALKRPDLYKAAYIKKFGGATNTGKRKALSAATLAIDAAVNAVQATKGGALTKAVKYPAKPEHTFVQTAGGMMAQTAVAKIAALQKKGVKVSPAAQKVAAQVKAAKSSKPKKAAKPAKVKKVQPAKKRIAARPATPKKVTRPAKPQRKTTKRR